MHAQAEVRAANLLPLLERLAGKVATCCCWYRRAPACTEPKQALLAQAEVRAANLLPLLERLAGEADPLLRRSVLTAVAALAAPGSSAGAFPEQLVDAWSERVGLPSHWCLCRGNLLTPCENQGLD